MRLQIKLQKKELLPARKQKSESLKKSLKLRSEIYFSAGVFFLVKLNQRIEKFGISPLKIPKIWLNLCGL